MVLRRKRKRTMKMNRKDEADANLKPHTKDLEKMREETESRVIHMFQSKCC